MLRLSLLVAAVGLQVNVLAATDGGNDLTGYLLQGGPFALVVLLIVTDKLGPHGERDRLRTENDLLRNEIKELNQNVRQEIVPRLTELTKILPDLADLVPQIIQLVTRLTDATARSPSRQKKN